MYFVCIHVIELASRYELSVLSMLVLGFQKKFGKRVGGWGELYPIILGFFFNYPELLETSTNATNANASQSAVGLVNQ